MRLFPLHPSGGSEQVFGRVFLQEFGATVEAEKSKQQTNSEVRRLENKISWALFGVARQERRWCEADKSSYTWQQLREKYKGSFQAVFDLV